jgi:hypothetical protein
MKVVEDGGEPKAVVRDASKYLLMLPEPVPPGPARDGLPGAIVTPADFRTIGYLAGFPDEIAVDIARLSAERGEHGIRARELKDAGWKFGGSRYNRDRHLSALKHHGLSDSAKASTVIE